MKNQSSLTLIEKQAAFGAGCFWGTEKFFKRQFGNALHNVAVGYMGGNVAVSHHYLVFLNINNPRV